MKYTKKSRTEFATLNTSIALALQPFQVLLGFINRTIFINLLGVTYLGLNNYLSSLVSILSLAELGVAGAMALGHDVAHTQHLEHGTHRTTGNHAGTVSSRGDVHARSAVTAFDDVRNRAAAQGHLEHLAACFVHGFLHRHGHLAGLALAHADATITVTNHDQGCKTQNPTTFNNLGDPVDADHLFLQTVITLIGPALRATRGSDSHAQRALPLLSLPHYSPNRHSFR